MKPVYPRQRSREGMPWIPLMSPLRLHHARSGSAGAANNMKKAQTKAAAQALAQGMSHQTADDDDNEDDYLSYDYQLSGIGSIWACWWEKNAASVANGNLKVFHFSDRIMLVKQVLENTKMKHDFSLS